MNYLRLTFVLTILFITIPSYSQTSGPSNKIVEKPGYKTSQISLFSLSDVRILSGDFKHIEELNHDYLLSLEPDKLLSWFRREAGLTSKVSAYPFWESEDVWGGGPLAGHIMGFYLSSMSMMYETTSDPAIKKKLEYTVNGLKECQDAQEDGYLLATINGRHIFLDVIEDNFKTNNPTINGVWEPVYIMNKIMLGLYNTYLACDIPMAKDVLVKMGYWFGYAVLDKLSHQQIQKLLVCEHGSINESFVDIYSITGDKKFLDWACALNDEDMWIPASEKRDILNGWHANTQIPKFTGFERVYTYTGENKYTDAARFFWQTVVDKHTWVIGGNSTGEHFFPTDEFEKRISSIGGPESCNSVNMMRLTEALYSNYGEMDKIDYYERVLYNHILANYDPHEGMCTYYTSMRPAHYRVYGTKFHSFWCCTGTGMEAPAKFAKMIYAYKDNDLYVNIFIPSEVNWKEKGIRLIQNTRFPDQDMVEFTVNTTHEQSFSLNIRHPYWLQSKQLSVIVNGKPVGVKSKIGEYATVNRAWKNGDRVQVQLTPSIRVEALRGSDKYAAILYGPIVMAAQIDNYGLNEDDYRIAKKTIASDEIPMLKAPAIFGDISKIIRDIKKEKGDVLKLTCSSKNASATFYLIPFSRIHFNRYAIYFPVYKTKKEYDRELLAERSQTEQHDYIINNTVDRVMLKSPESEADHHLDGVNMSCGEAHGLTWRHAENGGYIMYQMSVLPNRKQDLYLLFIKHDSGSREFEVMIDGKTITTINHNAPRESSPLFYWETVPIPEDLIKNKNTITVKLQAKRKNIVGGLFDLRIVKR